MKDEKALVQSSDGKQIHVPWHLAKQMVTLCNAAEDTDIHVDVLPLPFVNASVFCSIVNLLEVKEVDNENQMTTLSDQVARFSFEELLALLTAVNYLDVPPLFPSLFAALADHFASLNDTELVRAQSQQILTDLLKQLVFFFRTKDQVETFQRHVQLDWLDKMVQSYAFRWVENRVNWAIQYAAEYGHRDVVELLLNALGRGIDPAAKDNEAIRWAAANGHRDVVELLLNTLGRGIDPAAGDNWAIRLAAAHGRRDVVELLLNTPGRGIDPAVNDNQAIRWAAANGYRDTVELLLDYFAQQDQEAFERALNTAKRPAKRKLRQWLETYQAPVKNDKRQKLR